MKKQAFVKPLPKNKLTNGYTFGVYQNNYDGNKLLFKSKTEDEALEWLDKRKNRYERIFVNRSVDENIKSIVKKVLNEMSNHSYANDSNIVDQIAIGYFDAIIFADTYNDDELDGDGNASPYESNDLGLTPSDFPESDWDRVRTAIKNFLNNTPKEWLDDYFVNYQDAWDYIGHDFWLTSKGHGVGFWDRGVTYGDELSKNAEKYGVGEYAYISDGKIRLD